jgi:hypothetical protein
MPRPARRNQVHGGGHGSGAALSAELLWITISLLAGLALAVAVTITPVTRWRRRQRRRRLTDPAQRTVAAWHEALDNLTESGTAVARSATSGEVVTAVATRWGPDAARTIQLLANLHNQAAYAAPPVPGSVAETAWFHTTQFRQSITRSLPLRRRIHVQIHPHRARRSH